VVAFLQLSPQQAAQLRIAFEQFVRVKLNLIEQHQDAAATMTAATDRKAQQMQARAAREAALQDKPAPAESSLEQTGLLGSNSMSQLGDLADLDLDLDVDFDLGGLEYQFDQVFDQQMLQLSADDESAASGLQDSTGNSTAQMQDVVQTSNTQQHAQQQLQLQPDAAAGSTQEQQQDTVPAAVAWAGAESAAELRLRSILAGSTVASNMLSFTIISTLDYMQLARLMIGCYPVLPRSAASKF
jgi:hypothetical protein